MMLKYTQTGYGQSLLLLHGFCETQAIWKDFAPILSQNFNVITPDMGGFGENSHHLPGPCSIETLAEQIHEILEYLSVQKVIVVGHSLGGYVALALAEKYPQKINKNCLFHSTALPDTPEKQATRNKVIEFVQKVGVNSYIETFVSPLFYQKRLTELHQERVSVENMGKTTPLATILAVLAAMRDRKNHLELIRNAFFPIMYIIGKEDKAISFDSYEEQIHLNPLIRTCILEETGHLGMLERPNETMEALQNFCLDN